MKVTSHKRAYVVEGLAKTVNTGFVGQIKVSPCKWETHRSTVESKTAPATIYVYGNAGRHFRSDFTMGFHLKGFREHTMTRSCVRAVFNMTWSGHLHPH
jgi:hypothetical protein